MKKVLDVLKSQVKNHVQDVKTTLEHSDVSLENDLENLKELLKCIKSKSIRFLNKKQLPTGEERQKDVPKKRGRPTKTSTLRSEPRGRSDSSESMSLNDSVSSTSSTRSRRAAAQAAEHKLAHVQSLSQLKTKLRRPTDFNEKQSKAVSSPPPAKCRRTTRNQSGGSSSVQSEVNGGTEEEENGDMIVVDSEKLDDKCLNTKCLVSVEKLNTPTINSYTCRNSRSSRSLDRAAARNSNDMFSVSAAPNSDPTNKTNKNKSLSKKDLDSGISSTEEEIQHLMKANLPMAHSSPILMESFDDAFRGFDDQPNNNKVGKQAAANIENTFVVDVKTEETRVFSKKTITSETEKSSSEEIETTETKVIKSRTKVLRKRGAQTAVNVEEKENLNRNNETHIITSKPENSPNIHSRTKVLKKAVDHMVKSNENDEKNSEEDLISLISPEMKTRRTKTVRKQNEQNLELKSESEIVGRSLRSRTNTRNNAEKEEQSDSSDDEASNTRSRTKTIKKAATNIATNGLNSEYLISEFKDNHPSNKMNNRLPPISPAPAKGELVKKRVEDFEKMQNGAEELAVEEETTVGRVTRNAVKKKVTSSATEAQSSKHVRNIPVSKVPLSSERPRMTPLGVNNRVTPGSDSALKAQTNKWTNSNNRPTPVETNSVTLIHKQAAEEAEKKRKEEERLKRQAKEEEAKRKKEKTLKATAEEARRKRLEKLQKVAATREAAEKEKERTVAKAEKEKEEKMRQIAIEKEKQKEEHLMKKKQLTQQKMQEHEERRRQEEAARLAKLKEQEEEHKRLLAMKEREQELLKQQKAELRLAEAEKIKHQGGKLGKLAAVNNAKLKMQQGMTPSEKTNGAQSSKSYEITPAREDRPLLQPKSENDYGIDDAHSGDSSDDESQPKKMIPAWAQSKNRERLLLVNKYIPKKLWDMFMECDPCPDINQIFAGDLIKKRIRTSSAVWRTPPKYSRVAP